jgi:predicted metal-dependent phosphoesterase TrpH
MPAICDLHNHTLYSDGHLAPAALVDLAASRGVAVLAVTDHDTLEGIEEARARGVERGVEVVPGIELSVEEGSYDVHLLGYFVSRPETLKPALDEIQRERVTRALRIVERLAELGIELEYAAVQARARGGVVGRPHVAEELVFRGHTQSVNEAFDRYLGVDRPAYVAKRSVGLADGVRLLRDAGAVPVVAHPGASDLDDLIPWLADLGVLGLEVWHPKHDERETRRYLGLAERHRLVPTGGSDFHREAPGATLPGDLRIPVEVLDALRPHAT